MKDSPSKPVAKTNSSLPTWLYPSLLTALFVLGLLMVATVPVAWYKFQQTTQKLSNSLHIEHERMLKLEYKLAASEEQIEKNKTFIQSATSTSPQNIKQQIPWHEALFMLRMSSYSLLFLHDKTHAIDWLHQANNLLLSHESPVTIKISKDINQAITQLSQQHEASVRDIITQLQNLDNKLQLLHQQIIQPQNSAAQLEKRPDYNLKDESKLKRLLHYPKKLWGLVRDSIHIYHTKSTTPLILTPSQLFNVKSTLGLLIDQAQWAVLNHDNVVYSHALQQIQNLLNKHFENLPQQTQAILIEIDTLSQYNPSPDYPSITNIIQNINQTIKSQINPADKTANQTAPLSKSSAITPSLKVIADIKPSLDTSSKIV